VFVFACRAYPERSKTFKTKTTGKEWAATIEADLARGVDMVSKESRTKTVGDMIDRYIDHYLPIKDHNKDADKTKALLLWWKERPGAYALANVTSASITEIRDELRAGKTYRKTRRSPKTVNRYLAALSHCFKIAVKEWHWLNRSPMENVARYSENGTRRTLHLIEPVLAELEVPAKVRHLKSDLVFPGVKDPAKPLNSREAFTNAVARAEIDNFKFHDLCHSAASYMAMNGASSSDDCRSAEPQDTGYGEAVQPYQ